MIAEDRDGRENEDMRLSEPKQVRGHRRWRSTRAIAVSAALLLLLAACAEDGGTGSTEAGETATTEGGGTASTAASGEDGGEPADGEPVVVTAWFNGETVPADEFAILEEEFNVVVEWDIRGDTILTDLLRMRDAGEQLPDMVEIDSHLTPAFMEADLLAPMTEEIATFEEEDPELYATIPESVWTDGTYDDEIYHVPNKSLVDALYYNVNLVEGAGAEPPPYDTYWDMIDAALQIQEANPDLPAFYGTGGTSHDRMFRWAFSFGVPFEGNIPDVTSDQGVEMIDFLQTMYEEGITDPEFMIGQQDEAKGAFVAGELAFIDEGLNGGPGFMLEDFQYGEDWLTAPYPVHEDNGGVYLGVPRGWSMTAETEHPYEASLILRYLSMPEIAAERYFVLESGIVQSIPVLEGEQMAEEQPFFTPELLEIFRGLEAQIPPATNTNAVGEVFINLLDELTVTGTDETPAEVAARYQPMFEELR